MCVQFSNTTYCHTEFDRARRKVVGIERLKGKKEQRSRNVGAHSISIHSTLAAGGCPMFNRMRKGKLVAATIQAASTFGSCNVKNGFRWGCPLQLLVK